MAINTEFKRMQQLTGKFADLNTDNMLVGELAVPNDHNPVVKMDNGEIREIPLLSDMDSYEAKIQEVNGAIVELNNEYESTKNQLIEATKANADNAAESATAAATSANSASTYEDNAKTYMDNANAYAKEAKEAASSITGALKPKGTITFNNLPNLSATDVGAMYNISDEFVSTDSFKDGGGITYPPGTNIYKTEDNMWDCLAGQLGDYLMKNDIDTAVEESMPDYTASDQLTELVAGEKMSTALGKIKTAVKNVISLIKLLGTTDISKIGDGSVTGAISTLNSNMNLFGVSTLLDNWYGTHNVETTVTLVDSIDKYDLIIIACGFQGAGNPDGANKILPVSRVKKSAVGNPFVLGNCGQCYYQNNTTLGITPLNNMNWDIYGVRFSNKQYN